MGRINAAWHLMHKMPSNTTEAERAAWHYEHARHCGCRAVTPSIAALLETHGYRLPPDVPGLAQRKIKK